MKKVVFFLAVALMGLAANAQTVFSENFDNVSTPSGVGNVPSTWTLYGDNLTNNSNYSYMGNSWKVVNFSDMPSKMAYSCSWTAEATMCDRWMVTPAIAVPATGNYYLAFDIYGPNPSYPESLKVLVSTTNVQKTSFTDIVYNEPQVAGGQNTHLVNLSAYAGQTVYFAFVNYGTDALFVAIDNVEVKVFEPNGIAYVDGMVESFIPVGSSANFYTMVQNRGYANMTSYTMTYTLGSGATPITRNVTGINVAPYSYYIDTIALNTANAGLFNIAINVSAPNGQTDPDLSDNTGSLSTIIYNPSDIVTRTSLLENFTTGQCQYCPSGHDRLHQAIAGMEDNFVWVAHHTGYGSDAMTLTESEQLAGYYTSSETWVPGLFGQEGSWAPAMALDRNVDLALGASEGGVIGSISSDVATISAQLADALAVPSFVTVGFDNIAYDATTRQLTLTVSGYANQFYGTEPRLSVYLLEDSIIARQADAQTQTYIQNYVHNNVIRHCISDKWGDADAFTANTGSYSKSYTYTLPSTMNAAHCRVVAFVNDYGPDYLHRTVMNATQSEYLTSPTLSIAAEPSMRIVTYPNPAVEMAYISAESMIRSYEVVDAMGRKVIAEQSVNANVIELNVSGLAAGVYFVSVTTDNGTSTERLSVVK